MQTVLQHAAAQIQIEALPDGRKRIVVQPKDPAVFVSSPCCETAYPDELISRVLDVKGPEYLCDEIQRDEDAAIVQPGLVNGLLGYIPESDFAGKRLLDFGCGCGASSMILTRLLPTTQIVGIELLEEFLDVARARAAFHKAENVRFIVSPRGDALPDEIGVFDFILLNAVYEHLLPHERKRLLPLLWSVLKPGGVLFVTETPYRFFPIESHTTGLPFINYLPDRIAYAYARTRSNRVASDETWEVLLRRGIRGGTEREITRILREDRSHRPDVLVPNRRGMRDTVDLWHVLSFTGRRPAMNRALRIAFRLARRLTGRPVVPWLYLALRKTPLAE